MRIIGRKKDRQGLAIPEWFAVLGGLGIIIVFAVTQLGDTTKTELQKTSSDFLDPSKLTERYKPKGNNGFGNGGGDGTPNGFQDDTR